MKNVNWIGKSIVPLLMLSSTLGIAGQEKGGGDEYGLQAAASLRQAVYNLGRYGERLLTKTQLGVVQQITNKLVILMVDNELPAQANGVTQNGVAYSQSGETLPLTMIKRDRWAATKDSLERQAIMAHEVFVLSGIESTGSYTVSGEFLRLLRADPDSTSEPAAGPVCDLVKTEYALYYGGSGTIRASVYYSVIIKSGKDKVGVRIAETKHFLTTSGDSHTGDQQYHSENEVKAYKMGVALIKQQVEQKTCSWDGSVKQAATN